MRKRNCWITEHYSNEWKKVDWYWTSRTLTLCVQGLEESDQSFFDTIKQYSEKKMEQLNSTEFNSISEVILHKDSIGRMIVGKFAWQQEVDQNEDISIALIIQGTILHFRALQEHSRHNLIDPPSQDNVKIQRGLFLHIHHIGCAFNLHSIINNGLILGGQDSKRR